MYSEHYVRCTVYSVRCTVYRPDIVFTPGPRRGPRHEDRGWERLGPRQVRDTISGMIILYPVFISPVWTSAVRETDPCRQGAVNLYMNLYNFNASIEQFQYLTYLSHYHAFTLTPEDYLSRAEIRDSLERVSCSMNKQEFYEKFIRQRGWD